MSFRFNTEKIETLIKNRGLKKGFIIKQLDTSTTTFRRWMTEETAIPLIKAAQLAKVLGVNIEELITEE